MGRPALVRHCHSRRMAVTKPSSSSELKAPSAYSLMDPKMRSSSASVMASRGNRPVK